MSGKNQQALGFIASKMGKKGGAAGKGKAKKRGNSSYYRDMQRKSVVSRLANAKGMEKGKD